MATYRLKSKLYGEFDGNEKKNTGILGTGITLGQAAGLAATAAIGMKGYNRFQNNQFNKNLNTLVNRSNQIKKSGLVGADKLSREYVKQNISKIPGM